MKLRDSGTLEEPLGIAVGRPADPLAFQNSFFAVTHNERPTKTLLVSSEALRVGLGTANDLAGLAGSRHLDRGASTNEHLARTTQPTAVLFV